jgi:hypothetical protein
MNDLSYHSQQKAFRKEGDLHEHQQVRSSRTINHRRAGTDRLSGHTRYSLRSNQRARRQETSQITRRQKTRLSSRMSKNEGESEEEEIGVGDQVHYTIPRLNNIFGSSSRRQGPETGTKMKDHDLSMPSRQTKRDDASPTTRIPAGVDKGSKHNNTHVSHQTSPPAASNRDSFTDQRGLKRQSSKGRIPGPNGATVWRAMNPRSDETSPRSKTHHSSKDFHTIWVKVCPVTCVVA